MYVLLHTSCNRTHTTALVFVSICMWQRLCVNVFALAYMHACVYPSPFVSMKPFYAKVVGAGSCGAASRGPLRPRSSARARRLRWTSRLRSRQPTCRTRFSPSCRRKSTLLGTRKSRAPRSRLRSNFILPEGCSCVQPTHSIYTRRLNLKRVLNTQ